MPPRRDSSSSFVPPTLSPTHSCSTSQMSQSPQLENSPCPPSPLLLASDQFVDDISDIGDSDLDDDLSPVLDAMVMSSITALLCILDIIYFSAVPFTRLSQFPKTLPTSKFSGYKLTQNARVRYRSASLPYRSASLPMPTFERHC